MKKTISFSAFAGYYHHAGQCRGKGEREACQERDSLNPRTEPHWRLSLSPVGCNGTKIPANRN